MKTLEEYKSYIGKLGLTISMNTDNHQDYANVKVFIRDIYEEDDDFSGGKKLIVRADPCNPEKLRKDIADAWERNNMFVLYSGDGSYQYWELKLLDFEWDNESNG